MPRTNIMLAGTVVPVVIGLAAAAGNDRAVASMPEGEAPTVALSHQDAGALRLAACQPCGPCGACTPCAPCATACGPCAPCAACNPCAAGGEASTDCIVPRLAAACGPCSAYTPCTACNPCAAGCGPCNPCGACNPCAAGCGPCSPCGASEAVELTAAEATEAYACIKATMAAGYAGSGSPWAAAYQNWTNVALRPYVSDTHGARYVNNYANDIGAANYGLFEEAGPSPVGTVLAKDSFSVAGSGRVRAGPLFLMEKMEAGFDPDTGDWRYTLIMPNGRMIGTTGGEGAVRVGFCAECHLVVEEQDSRFFLDEEYRRQ